MDNYYPCIESYYLICLFFCAFHADQAVGSLPFDYLLLAQSIIHSHFQDFETFFAENGQSA